MIESEVLKCVLLNFYVNKRHKTKFLVCKYTYATNVYSTNVNKICKYVLIYYTYNLNKLFLSCP